MEIRPSLHFARASEHVKRRPYSRARKAECCDEVGHEDAAISVRFRNCSLYEFNILKRSWRSVIVSIRSPHGRSNVVRRGRRLIGAVTGWSRFRWHFGGDWDEQTGWRCIFGPERKRSGRWC